jgi:hypothetical protein
MNNGNGNGNTVLLTVIGVATLLVALVGATFAYFTATVSNTSAQSFSVTTATPVGLVYAGQKLTMANAIPGDSAESSFTVENPSTNSETGAANTVNQSYDLVLKIDGNEFSYTDNTDSAKQLVLTLSATSTGNNTPSLKTTEIDFTSGTKDPVTLVDDQKIEVGEKQTYSLTLNFNNLESYAQDNNQGKSFNAHIEITDYKSI